MNQVKSIFLASSKELSHVQKLVLAALLLAMVVVLKTIGLNNDYVKAGFNAIPANLAYMILGPVSGMIFAVTSDLLGTFVLGQTVNLGITFTAMINGLIMGAILYKHSVSLVRVIVAVLLKVVICSLLLNTLFIALMYFPLNDPGFWPKAQALFTTRVIKNAVEAPITIVVFYMLSKALEQMGFFRKLESGKML